VAAETVTLEATGGPAPEQLARHRSRVQELSQPDQAAVIAAYPLAAIPADPALPMGGLVPPADAPAGIPGPLLETIYHSYARRQAGLPGSDDYLGNAFGVRPANFGQALKQMGTALDVVRSVYARWTAAGLPWAFVDALYNAWSGTSDGFNFACHDPAGLETALDSSRRFCKDHVGGLYHWLKEGTTPSWREIVTGSPGLHVCTGGARTTMHIGRARPPLRRRHPRDEFRPRRRYVLTSSPEHPGRTDRKGEPDVRHSRGRRGRHPGRAG
jgi:hypothetical protein